MTDKKNNFAKDINVPRKEKTNDSLKNQDKNFNENCAQEKEQILLKDINETGFYCAVDDTERLYLYEVINNTNKEWLKKDSQAKLLIDEWIYDYTDYDDRKVYFTSGNLEATYNNTSTGKVYKIEDKKFKIYGNYRQFLVEDKLTYKEQLARKTQEYEQIKEKYEALKLENQEGYEIVAELKHECEELKEKYEEIKEDRYNLNMEMYTFDRYRKALEEIEVTANKAVDLPCVFSCDCNNCAEKPTKNGDTCIQGAIFKIADIIKKVKKLSNNGVIMGIFKERRENKEKN